ncbi:hypothetical protein BN903_213 [Halorubrum sp. AJ67]|nr:hypothetical protein BN903_213 [Halorubrum sp. AJ67]
MFSAIDGFETPPSPFKPYLRTTTGILKTVKLEWDDSY